MPRRNRIDPWGDLHAVAARGLLTGNRGCVVDDHEHVVRHHGSALWIACVTKFRDWRFPLARPRRWTPLFFLDDAVALAAGHRPCATCRRADYTAYRDAVTRAIAAPKPLLGAQLNQRLQAERHRPGRGLDRAGDRITWSAPYAELPDGTVVVAADGLPARGRRSPAPVRVRRLGRGDAATARWTGHGADPADLGGRADSWLSAAAPSQRPRGLSPGADPRGPRWPRVRVRRDTRAARSSSCRGHTHC